MRIGFVIPWFAMNISGGAETELRGLVTHFHAAGMDLEVLTTCVQQFNSDWNVDYYKEGLSVEEGIPIRRFPVRQRDGFALTTDSPPALPTATAMRYSVLLLWRNWMLLSPC